MQSGDRVPSISLERVAGGGAVNLQQEGRDATVIVKLPATGSERFIPYLETLAEAGPEFHDWGGRLLAVVVGGTSQIESFGFPVLRDDAHATDDWAAVDEAVVVVADRYGVVYHEAHGGSLADLPGVDEVVEWLRFLATQCPECGVPDEPGLGEFA